MPVLENLNITIDIDNIPRQVVTMGLKAVIQKHESDFHSHRKAQCIMAMSGVMTCEAEGGIRIVPPQTAVWIPAGVEHCITWAGNVEGYNAFIEPAAAFNLPDKCCSILVSPLLRELIVRTAQYPITQAEGGMESRVASLMLEEIAISEIGHLHLPMPRDQRLRRIFRSIIENPSDRGTMEDWAKRIAMSERTFARLMVAETGMSFGRWRQQINIILALQWLVKGVSIQQVASDLGYENVGSFVTMFRKAMGAPPGRYMAERAV